MVRGTMSNAGKSFLVADSAGYLSRTATRWPPSKSQNMATQFLHHKGQQNALLADFTVARLMNHLLDTNTSEETIHNVYLWMEKCNIDLYEHFSNKFLNGSTQEIKLKNGLKLTLGKVSTTSSPKRQKRACRNQTGHHPIDG